MLPLPPDVTAGIMIGSGGKNVQWLKDQSGLRGRQISVTDTSIALSGPPHLVSVAEGLVSTQLESFPKHKGLSCAELIAIPSSR